MCGIGWATQALSPTADTNAKERVRVMDKAMAMYLLVFALHQGILAT